MVFDAVMLIVIASTFRTSCILNFLSFAITYDGFDMTIILLQCRCGVYSLHMFGAICMCTSFVDRGVGPEKKRCS